MKELTEPLYEIGQRVILNDDNSFAKVLERQPAGNQWLYTVEKEGWWVLGYEIEKPKTTLVLEREIKNPNACEEWDTK